MRSNPENIISGEYMAFRKYARKVGKKVGRAIKGRYFKGKGYGNPKLSTMARDINLLRSMVNSEKKRINISNRNLSVGQVSNATGSGHFLLDITPNPTQGTGYQNKTGSSIKLHSTHIDFQFSGQASTISGMRLKIEIVKVVGQPFSTMSDVMGKFILPNNFITGGTVYDMSSSRDPDYFRNYVVIARKFAYLPPDQLTGDVPLKQVSMGIKYKNHHVRNNDNDPTLSSGQIFMLITADRGNNGGSASTLTGIAVSAAATGATLAYDIAHYFYDN